MEAIASVRWAGVVLLLAGSVGVAQTALSPTSATVSGSAANTAMNSAGGAAQSEAVASPSGHRAQVVFSRGELTITADDSSLDQILRDIGRQTGMKITGGVSDDRVYGTYGPARPDDVLASLLDGTGSNMVLRESAERAPVELILTPRTGGVTPPNPNARNYDDDAATEPVQPTAPVQQAAPPQSAGGVPGAAAGGTAPGASPSSPNGVQTPQQVFEQLQRLQQAQQH